MGVEEEVAVEGGAVALVRRVRGAEGGALFSDVAIFHGSNVDTCVYRHEIK